MLLYTTTITRSDTVCIANKLLEYLNNSFSIYLNTVDRAILYLYSTKSLAIEYFRNSEIFLYTSNTAFADNIDRKNTEEFLFKLFGRPIDWRASKQKTVTISITEAELLALSYITKKYQ